MDDGKLNQTLLDIYARLFHRYGPQHWWPAREPFEVIVGAILTQSTAWTNVEKAIASLRASGNLSAGAIRRLSGTELAGLIRSCGYYNVKAKRLKSFVEWLGERYSDNLDAMFSNSIGELRRELLTIYGIGEETADSIMLYAGDKPVFVIDAYTRRILDRLGLTPAEKSYAACQKLFMMNLPPEAALFNEYHALLVHLGKDACRKSPRCAVCCLSENKPVKPGDKFPCSRLA
ncbi:MAG: endonuclease [Chloroflexi bacterium RBG_16_56_11]|nr:MAG: endonuclease [Chloroflexi bacterium RBG_16_56_11]